MRWFGGAGRYWLASTLTLLILIGHHGLLRAQNVAPQTVAANTTCTGATPVSHARRVVTRGTRVLSDDMVTLPDTLPYAWRNEQVTLRYEIDVSTCAGSPSVALSLFRVGAPFVATAHGAPIGSLLTQHWFEPSLHDTASAGQDTLVFNGRIPNLLALPLDARTLEIRLLTLPYIPVGLAGVALGPTNALLPEALANLDQVVGYSDAAAGVMLVLALMAGCCGCSGATIWVSCG